VKTTKPYCSGCGDLLETIDEIEAGLCEGCCAAEDADREMGIENYDGDVGNH